MFVIRKLKGSLGSGMGKAAASQKAISHESDRGGVRGMTRLVGIDPALTTTRDVAIPTPKIATRKAILEPSSIGKTARGRPNKTVPRVVENKSPDQTSNQLNGDKNPVSENLAPKI